MEVLEINKQINKMEVIVICNLGGCEVSMSNCMSLAQFKLSVTVNCYHETSLLHFLSLGVLESLCCVA